MSKNKSISALIYIKCTQFTQKHAKGFSLYFMSLPGRKVTDD